MLGFCTYLAQLPVKAILTPLRFHMALSTPHLSTKASVFAGVQALYDEAEGSEVADEASVLRL